MILESGLPHEIAPEEDLVRFLFSGDYNSVSVKPRAFQPTERERVTSVFRHGKEPLEDLWALGDEAVKDRIDGKEVKAAAFFKASVIDETDFELVAKEPPPRHAEIGGWNWPEPGDPEHKAKLIEQALVIAAACTEPFIKAQNLPSE